MDEDSNFEKMKKIVKDADMYEENMSRADIEMVSEVITKSRMEVESQEDLLTLMDEDTTSDIGESPSLLEGNPTFTPKTWSFNKPKSPVKSEEIDEDESDDFISLSSVESLKDATKSSFGFNDMPESSENSLRFIPRDHKFIPIQSTTTFLKASCCKKTKMLYSYHTKMKSLKAQLARSSFFPAPVENSISTEEVVPSVSDSTDSQDTYISRSGRQTKRKVYYDQDEDSVDGPVAIKKTKSFDEQEWPCKIKTPTRKTEKASEGKDVGDLEKNTVTNEDKKLTSKTSENVKSTARPKKLKNAEIMKRSRLFANSPPQLTRNDIIFNSLVEENTKKEKEEKVMDSFKRSLTNLGDESETTDEVINVDEEEPIRQRVVPPLPGITGRKPINSRKKRRESLDIKITTANKTSTSTKSPTPSTSQDSTGSLGPPQNKKKSGPNKTTTQSSPTTSRNKSPVSNKVPCPVCGVNFSSGREIEEHAWNCEPVSTRSQNQQRITCHICDTVVPLSTEYEVHVHECLRKKREEEENKNR